jgi:hypothetical protein
MRKTLKVNEQTAWSILHEKPITYIIDITTANEPLSIIFIHCKTALKVKRPLYSSKTGTFPNQKVKCKDCKFTFVLGFWEYPGA